MDIDHMLNGRGSRQHHQNMIREAQRNRLSAEADKYQEAQQNEPTPPHSYASSPIFHRVLVKLVSTITNLVSA